MDKPLKVNVCDANEAPTVNYGTQNGQVIYRKLKKDLPPYEYMYPNVDYQSS